MVMRVCSICQGPSSRKSQRAWVRGRVKAGEVVLVVADCLLKHQYSTARRPDMFVSEILALRESAPDRRLDRMRCLLQRMGSFTSAPKILNDDTQDSDVHIPERLTREQLLARCHRELADRPSLVKRTFRRVAPQVGDSPSAVRLLQWNVLSKVCGEAVSSPNHIRVLQWNVLSQALGQMNDNFVCCPDEALDWSKRRYQIVEEIVEYCPDVILLQEVDHFSFLKKVLGSQGYSGMFFPKPDSPCLYIQGNNGPDGCAIFYRNSKFDLLKLETRVLEVWRVQSNQVAILAMLRVRETGQEVCVATTHLKARNGALLSTLRNEQGKDLLEFVIANSEGRPVIMGGDFNAEPTEPIYLTLLGNRTLHLASAYTCLRKNDDSNNIQMSADLEPPYTTWKIRDEGEVCHTIDYVFYTRDDFVVEALLEFPTAVGFGGSCKKGPDCVSSLGDGGQCNTTSKTCSCQPEFMYDNSSKTCVYKVGRLGEPCGGTFQKCVLDADGNDQHTACVNKICRCQSPYVPSLDRTRCMLVKMLNDPCQLHAQCTVSMGNGAQCLNKICACQPDFVYKNNTCSYKISREGEECSPPNRICYVDADGDRQSLQCVAGKCQHPSAAPIATLSLTAMAAAITVTFRTFA